MQNLGKNKIFGSIDSVGWISKIELSENRENQIRESFCYASVEFDYPIDIGEFEMILESLKENQTDVNIDHEDLGIGSSSWMMLVVLLISLATFAAF